MQETMIRFDSLRARRARLGKTLGSNSWYVGLLTAAATLAVLGIAVLASGQAVGWLVVSLGGPLVVLALWGKSLLDVPPAAGTAVGDVLDTYLLARLHKDYTLQELVKLVSKTHGGGFFNARFLISFELVAAGLTENQANTAAIWSFAEQLRLQHQAPTINGAIIAVALMYHSAGLDEYLAHFGLDRDDVVAGLKWYQHVEQLIAESKQHRPAGGIGRDWSFGYTPLLDRLGYNITEHITYSGLLSREVSGREALLGHISNTLSQNGRRNIVLVGGLGSGKTKVVHSLAEKLLEADPSVPKSLHFHQIVSLDPATLIAQAHGRGELEDLVQHLFFEALKAKNVILFLDDAHLFFEESTGSVNLSNVLLPILDGGALRIILAMDEQRWTRIVQENPGLAQYLNRIVIPPTNEPETMEIMQNQIVLYEFQQNVTYTYHALLAAYRLSSRFIAEQVMPGKALKLLESAARFAEGGLVTQHSIEQSIEQTQGVKVGTANTAAERETLVNLEQLIHGRMINQSRAVKVVSDALRRARAGVRNTNRPIGTFLFLGPTGVGKTELAKSVASVFFGDESQLVRLDMNEYVRSEDVARLIADAAHDSRSLTAQITRQPFSVVLLDEIEKAHPEVLNTLLQLLDEGILRDITNREVSFRDAVIIATSNAGADRIRQHIDAGEELEQFEEQFINELISSNTFRPEFLNRFDEIVLFRPLKPEELRQVVDLILQGVNKTLAAQKLSVVVDDDAKALLVEAGYDARLGARPLRRVVQRTVENIVANQVLNQQAQPGGQIHVSKDDVQAMLTRS